MCLCNNSDQTSFSVTLTSAGPFGLRFQHLPRGPADVNALKHMFDPKIRFQI